MNIHNEIKLIFDIVPMLIFPKQAWVKTAWENVPTLLSSSSRAVLTSASLKWVRVSVGNLQGKQ